MIGQEGIQIFLRKRTLRPPPVAMSLLFNLAVSPAIVQDGFCKIQAYCAHDQNFLQTVFPTSFADFSEQNIKVQMIKKCGNQQKSFWKLSLNP